MKVNREQDYAIILAVVLASHYNSGHVSLSMITRNHKLPERFIKKIASRLVAAGIIDGREGRRGGYRLAKPPGRISVGAVLAAVSNRPLLTPCLDKNHKASCMLYGKCPTRKTWEIATNALYGSLNKTSLEQLARQP